MNEIQTQTQAQGAVQTVDFAQTAQKFLSLCGQNVPANKAGEFIEIARAKGLNPFNREIYLVPFGQNGFNIITGYETYIRRAERSGKLDGWDVAIGNDSGELAAKITIYRKDWSHPFIHIVWLSEAKTRSPLWNSMPKFMLKKVAIAQGFRLCFTEENGGMPYTRDEISQGDDRPLQPIQAEGRA